jgi:DNA polymerase-3 subunit beta
MQLNVTKTNLQKTLSAVSRAVSSKPTIDVLRNIALEAKKGSLRVTATDLELSISTYVGVDLIVPGATTVLAKTFIEFVSLLPEGNISLTLENNELKVETDKIKSKFATIPYEEFPELPQVNETCELIFKVEKNVFIQAIDKTTFAADRSGISQPVFSGILFEKSHGNINLVSTDRYRLSRYSLHLDQPSKFETLPVIPYIALEHVARLCADSEDDYVEAFLINKNNQVLFKSGRIEITTSLIDGEFPNYQAFMPQNTVCTYKILVRDFVDAVKLSNVFAKTEDSIKVVIKKILSTDHILLSSKVSEVGEYQSELKVEIIKEEENIEVNFSPKKILDVLARVSTEYVYLDIVVHPRTEHRMAIFREEGNDNFLHLLTPLVGA